MTIHEMCRNLSLGLVTKARGCKVTSQEKDLGVTSHAPGSVKECEGVNPHTPK
jgi:hypothetical protein